MYCVNCGKQLIRGYQFCIECGTPVEDMSEEASESNEPVGAENSAMPAVEPAANGNGSLVFCSNCGMHMQTSTAFCEICGLPLSGGVQGNSAAQPAPASAVPLWNPNPIGDELSGMSDRDIDRVNNFMNGISDPISDAADDESAPAEKADEQVDLLGENGLAGYTGLMPEDYSVSSGGLMDSVGASVQPATNEEIDELTEQLARYSAAAASIPSVSAPAESTVTHMQEEIQHGEGIRVRNFSMEAADTDEVSAIDGVPIISGGSMDERPEDDVSLNPYGFLDNEFGDISPQSTSPISEKILPVNNAEPTAEEIAPEVEPAPYFNAVPTVEPTAEDIAPAVSESSVSLEDSAAPIFSTEPTAEDIAPEVEPAPYFNAVPTVEPIAENIAPAVPESSASLEDSAAPVFSTEPPAEDIAPATEPLTDEAVIDEGVPFIEEGMPFIEEYHEPVEPIPPVYSQPESIKQPVTPGIPPIQPIQPTADENAVPKENMGKLTYCHNCGQDIYEKEAFCQNCGAPNNAAVVYNPTPAAKSGRKFNKLIPIIAAAVVVVVGAAVAVFVTLGRNTNDIVSESDVLTVNVSDTSAPGGEPVNDNAAVVTAEDSEDASDKIEDGTDDFPEPPETTAAVTTPGTTAAVTTPTTTNKPESNPTEATTPAASTTPPATKPAATTAATTPKPTTTTTAKPASTAAPATTITSSKVISLEKDRDAIMDAAALIAGEVGRIDMLAQNVIYAMENSTGSDTSARTAFYNRDFAKNMLSSIESGKTAVDNAVSAASPANSEMKTAYDNLVTLQSKYNAYYNFIKSPSGDTDSFSTSCASYLTAVTSYVKSNFKYTGIITSSYSTSDTNIAYAAAMSDAVTAANNAISSFTSLQTTLTALSKTNFDTAASQELAKSATTKKYANAAAYAQQVAAYCLMLSGAPSDYSNAYSKLQTASTQLNELVDLYNMIQENDYNSYSNASTGSISSATNAVNSVKNAIS